VLQNGRLGALDPRVHNFVAADITEFEARKPHKTIKAVA
jgi:hypothetical protein